MKDNQPIISIITVVYNSASLLEATIRSVVEQSYPNIEYIIVDGASSDGSLAIIQAYESQISRWVSEPDKGLYDAMNKGLDLATGDFVWFMNAGDHLHHKDTVMKMIAQMGPDTDILYGEVLLVDEFRKALGTRSECTTQSLPEQLSWQSLRFGMVVSHQGFLPRRSLAPKYIPNNLSADIDWVIDCLRNSKQTTHTHLILADYLVGGLSRSRHRQSLADRFQVLQKQYGFLPNLLAHIWIVIRALWFKWIKGKEYV